MALNNREKVEELDWKVFLKRNFEIKIIAFFMLITKEK
jgi:hypothetical protein